MRMLGKKHTVTHDERAGMTAVSHLEAVECADPKAVRALLERAARLRAVGATAANERSSRSHMVFLLSIRGANATTGQRLNGADPSGCDESVFHSCTAYCGLLQIFILIRIWATY